eukprot:7588884-Heterocapsa_arctica.AAC.1
MPHATAGHQVAEDRRDEHRVKKASEQRTVATNASHAEQVRPVAMGEQPRRQEAEQHVPAHRNDQACEHGHREPQMRDVGGQGDVLRCVLPVEAAVDL